MRRFDMREKLEGNKFMEIEIKYDEGSEYMNTRRGYYIFFTHIVVEDGFKRFIPMDGVNFKMCVKEVKRFGKKQMKNIVDFMLLHKDKFFNLYKVQDRELIVKLLKEIK